MAFSKEIDSYLQDHFGLRHVLIRTHKDLTKPLLGLGNDSVLIGRDGRMFYLGEDTVRQSAGLVLRDRRVSETADLLAKISHALAAREIRFLVAIPPNAPSIFQDDLPHWAQDLGRPTEYDLILADLAERGVRAVDLRPSLKKTRSDGSVYYMYDTHWTPRGGLAAFDAIVEADGRPDWRIDPTSALGPPQPHSGDLARMLGVEGLTEAVENLTLTPGQADPSFPGESRPYVRPLRADSDDLRRLLYRRLFPPNAPAARRSRHLARARPLRLRLEGHRSVPSGRGLVDA